jgi:uncharacterized protein
MPLINDIFVFLAGFAGAFVGSISGGYALITVPALLLMGLPPHIALGTANFAGIGYSIGHLVKFSQHKNLGVPWRDVIILTLIAVPATFIGAKIVVSVDSGSLSKIMGVVLLVLLPLLFTNKNLGVEEKRAVGKQRVMAHALFFLSRVWTGFFSPGSGLLETYVKMRAYGYTILQGKAVTRIPHILSAFAGVLVFILSGFISWRYGVGMFIGMFVGGYFGIAFAIKRGDAWLKPIIGAVIIITAAKLIFFS